MGFAPRYAFYNYGRGLELVSFIDLFTFLMVERKPTNKKWEEVKEIFSLRQRENLWDRVVWVPYFKCA